MRSEKRLVGGPAPAANGRVAVGLEKARQRPFRGAFSWRILGAAILCLAFAGCSALHHGTPPRSTKQRTTWTKPSTHRKEAQQKQKRSLFSSWFRPEEPEPLETTNDWMALEQIRP
ncbi:MAG: hypothetical protein A2V98_16875 [Planctomycetes bacterium RBG_16_64_12]|nr:MAG: hypothetical protein A2V98_16875 [Planctomycetes bacterium RBG_16_64_12]